MRLLGLVCCLVGLVVMLTAAFQTAVRFSRCPPPGAPGRGRGPAFDLLLLAVLALFAWMSGWLAFAFLIDLRNGRW